jgi:TolB protein
MSPSRSRGFSYQCGCREVGAGLKPAPADGSDAYEEPHLTERIVVSLRYVLAGLVPVLVGAFCLTAGAKVLIDVDHPTLEPMKIVLPEFASGPSGQVNGREMADILRNDLFLTGLFHFVDMPRSTVEPTQGAPDFQTLSQAGAQALILGSVIVQGDEMILEGRVYDVALKKMELGKRFSGKARDHRALVHRFGDRILEALTGTPGCFSTRIAFVSVTQEREIYVMDFDGHNLHRVTQTGSINLSPEWAPDGRSILFTSYQTGKPDLWFVDLSSGRQGIVSSRAGINVSARYSRDGSTIALSMNDQGIPKVFLITPEGNIIKRLTSGRGNDISPTWSPDRSTIAYVSDQAGTPQIYMVPVNGGQSRRLTFDTNYSTDPDWSPRGDLLAFTGRIEGRFQICTIRTDGTGFKVLTEKGSNQAPAWSPDGRLIAFSSRREGTHHIYVMDMRGTVQAPVSPIPGKGPAWSSTRQ